MQIDIAALLEEILPDAPCGDNLEYDDAYTELGRTATAKEEKQIGSEIQPGEEPDWRAVMQLAIELFSRTKDLRVAILLTRASLKNDGLLGFHMALQLLKGLLERYWPCIYPQLDAEDNNDPTFRVNTLMSLCDQEIFRAIREAPLVKSQLLGVFSHRDVLIANGELSTEGERPEISAINGALMECDLDGLKQITLAVTESIQIVESIDAYVTEKVGVDAAPNFDVLAKKLKEITPILSEHLTRRDVQIEDSPEQDIAPTLPRSGNALSGEIQNRDDVVAALNKIADYYRRIEPSSPIPILLDRAKRLVAKDFMAILQDIAPDGVSQAEVYRGKNDD